MTFWNRRQEMGWASLILGVSILISRFMGLARDKIISYLFGATQESDLYFAAFVIPDFINYLLAGAYFSITLIPLLTTYFERDEEDGWKFFSAVLTWIVLFISISTLVAMEFAPSLAHLAAPGITGEGRMRLAFFLRIVMPAQICFLAGSCFSAILYMRKQFIVPAISPLVYNLFIILCGILWRSRGMEGFCWGVLLGAITGNLVLPYLAVRHGGGLRLRPTLYHPGLKKFIIVALPLMLGQSVIVLDEQLVRVFGSMAGIGAISWLNYARRIMLVPVAVVAQAAGVASYPFMADLLAKKDFQRFHATLNTALRNTLMLLLPLSLWMATVSEPTIRLIFEQGHFNASDTLRTSALLNIFMTAVIFWGFQQILGRGFYARQDTLTPTILGTLAAIASIPVYYFLAGSLGATGVAVASSLSVIFYALALGVWWIRRFGSEAFSGLGVALLQIGGISVMACAPTVFLTRSGLFPFLNLHPYIGAVLILLVSAISFAVIFVLLSIRFIPDLSWPFLEKSVSLRGRIISGGKSARDRIHKMND